MPKRCMETLGGSLTHEEAEARVLETAGRHPGQAPPLWDCAYPRPGFPPVPVSTRVWEREPGRGDVRLLPRCFLLSRGKILVLKHPNPTPNVHLVFG